MSVSILVVDDEPDVALLFRQQFPTEACVPGNGEVRSPRNNVTSSHGMAAEARAGAATASTEAVGDQEGVVWSTQVNRCSAVT